MLETLDARLAQTRDGTLGHLDFLQVLCEDEIARRESAALTRRGEDGINAFLEEKSITACGW